MRMIEKVAVLGAGTMGSRIAAHWPTPAFVLCCWTFRHSAGAARILAAIGLDNACKAKPAAFFEASLARLVTVGNFDDNLGWLADCDWIIEAVVEDLELSARCWARLHGSPTRNHRHHQHQRSADRADFRRFAARSFSVTGSARIFLIRRATCACWRSSPRLRPMPRMRSLAQFCDRASWQGHRLCQ